LFRGMVEMLAATVRGMGQEARCDVLARRVGLARGPVEVDCCVMGAPDDLPDVESSIEFAGICAVVARRLGVWAGFDPPLKGMEELPVLE
jgi:hypothetical protein